MVAGVTPKRAALARSMRTITERPLGCKSLATSTISGTLARRARTVGVQVCNVVEILIFQRELILGGADRGVDRQVLHRLHVERNAGDVGGLPLQAADDLAGARFALRVRLEIDQEAAGVERDVGAVDADERRQAFDVRIGRDRLGEGLLALGHRARRECPGPPG